MKILSAVPPSVKSFKAHGGSENTFYTWKPKTFGIGSDDIRKLNAHPSENQALKQIVAGQALMLEVSVKLLRKNALLLPDFRWCIKAQGVSVRGYHKARS